MRPIHRTPQKLDLPQVDLSLITTLEQSKRATAKPTGQGSIFKKF